MDHFRDNNLFLHREKCVVEVAGIPCIMMPYEEDQTVITDYIDQLKAEKGSKWLKKVNLTEH